MKIHNYLNNTDIISHLPQPWDPLNRLFPYFFQFSLSFQIVLAFFAGKHVFWRCFTLPHFSYRINCMLNTMEKSIVFSFLTAAQPAVPLNEFFQHIFSNFRFFLQWTWPVICKLVPNAGWRQQGSQHPFSPLILALPLMLNFTRVPLMSTSTSLRPALPPPSQV